MGRSKVGDIRTAPYGNCNGDRNCEVLGAYRDSGSDEVTDWATDWYILRCRGCDFTFAETAYTHSEDEDHEFVGGEWYSFRNETRSFWPALNARARPVWLGDLPTKTDAESTLSSMLGEVYGSLNNDSPALAAIGIRTCFDLASEVLGVDPSLTFEEKLGELQTRGHVSGRDTPRLQTLVAAGNATAHRGWTPSPPHLDDLMGIMEHFLEQALIDPQRRAKLDAKAQALSSTVPPKPPRSKKPKAAATEGDASAPTMAAPASPDSGSALKT